MNSGPKQASVLFDQYTLGGVSLFLVGAIIYRNPPLIIVAVFILMVSLVILIWKRHSLKMLEAGITLNTSRIFSGDEVKFTCSLKNNKWLPLVWLEWEQEKQQGLLWQANLKGNYQIRFLWLMGYQQVVWEVSANAERRGVYSIGKVLLRSGDAFRFSEIEETYELKRNLYVYPKLVSVTVPTLVNLLHWGTVGSTGGIMEDSAQVVGLRDYRSGDELKKIHWQATAKTGKLLTWVYKPVLPKQIFFCIDVEGFSLLEPDEFERFLSVIASVAFAFHKQSLSMCLVSNALDEQGRKISLVGPSKNITSFLDVLAIMTQHVSTQQGEILEERIFQGKLPGPILYFSNSLKEKHLSWFKKNRCAGSAVVFYYTRKTKYINLLKGQARPIESLLSEREI